MDGFMKILITTNAENFKWMEKFLGQFNYEVYTAQTISETLCLLQSIQPNVLLIDEELKDGEGVECIQQIRKVNKTLFIISLCKDPSNAVHCILAGANDYLIQPINEITLVAKVNIFEIILNQGKQISQQNNLTALKFNIIPNIEFFQRDEIENILAGKVAHADYASQLLSLFIVDIDNIQNINDAFGHDIGDMVLHEVAIRAKSALRKEDFLARVSGKEFVIILEEVENAVTANKLAEKILSVISAPLHLEKNKIDILCHIGIAFFPNDGTNQSTLITNAMKALSIAKQKQGSHFECFHLDLI